MFNAVQDPVAGMVSYVMSQGIRGPKDVPALA